MLSYQARTKVYTAPDSAWHSNDCHFDSEPCRNLQTQQIAKGADQVRMSFVLTSVCYSLCIDLSVFFCAEDGGSRAAVLGKEKETAECGQG